jgi:hypothetical protein
LVSPAKAATPGVGTALSSSSLLDVKLGSLLNLKLLADDARSTIDPSVAQPEAFSRLNALSLTSILPAPLNNISLPVVESKTPGGAASVDGPALNLSTLPGLSLPVSLLGGVLGATKLTSGVDTTGAHSGLTSGLGNVNLVGGLISATGLQSVLGTNAKGVDADGSRTIKAGAIDVLDLGALLNGLGIPLQNLPIGTVSSILKTLGVPVAGVPSSLSLAGFVGTLDQTLNGLQAQLAAASGGLLSTALPAPITNILSGLPGVGSAGVPVAGDPVAAVNGVIDTVQGLLDGVLSTALTTLDGLSLLKVSGIELGTKTVAADSVAGSAADIVAKIGGISVGGLSLPGLDLGATAAQVNGVLNTVNGTLGSVLGAISPDLANLVKVNLFAKDPSTGVTQSGGYIKSLAGVSALTANIVPPLNLSSIVGGLTSAGGIGSLLTGAGGTLPVLDTLMPTLNGLLPGAVSALAEGASIKLASVTSGASFTTPGSPVGSPTGALPRTGGTAQMALLGMALVIAAVASRRYVLANRVTV